MLTDIASVYRFAAVLATMTSGLYASGPCVAQTAADTSGLVGSSDTSDVGKIGHVHDGLRRAAARESLDEEAAQL